MRFVVVALMMTLAGGCTQVRPEPMSAEPYVFRLGPGDRLKITTYGEEALSGEYAVNGEGVIAFPLLGDLPARGKTIGEFRAALLTQLGTKLLKDPSVSVEVLNIRPVFILGEVNKPGQFAYTDGLTITAVVAQAGGFTYRADEKTVWVRHENEAEERPYALGAAAPARPGDTITIRQRYF